MAPSRGPLIAFEHSNRLASHSSEGADLSLHGAPLGGELPMLQSVSVALGSPATGPVHPADAMAAHRRRSARLPAPLRFGVASQCLVHRSTVHGVVTRASWSKELIAKEF